MQSATIWELSEPVTKPRPELSRESIVSTAIQLADSEGLAGVSLRKVAAVLDAGPMRLYGYIPTKQALLDLMVDRLYAELLDEGRLPKDWKRAMRVHAVRLRNLTQTHPWFLSLIGGRPHQGPKALEHLEQLLAPLSHCEDFRDIDGVLRASQTIQAYLIGALQNEARELDETASSGLNKKEWQEATGAYLAKMISTGKFPTIAKVMVDANHPSLEEAYLEGLDCVLDGVINKFGR